MEEMPSADEILLRLRIGGLVSMNPGIDAEEISERLGITLILVDDLVAKMCATGELALTP